MELVYLWVDNYKNIREQEFIFNRNVDCTFEYKKKIGHIEGKLNISIKKDKKVSSLFPSNINVTAIIGKNGSGKSSILEFILLFLTQEKHIQNKYRGILIFKDRESNFVVYSNIGKLGIENEKILHLDLKKYTIEEGENELNEFLQSIIFPYFNYSLTYHNILNYTNRMNKDEIKLHFPMIPDKGYGKIDLVENDRNIEKIILNSYKIMPDDDKSKIYSDFFKPKYLEVYINYQQLRNENNKLKDEVKKDVLEKIEESKNYFYQGNNKKAINLIYDILELKSAPQNVKTTMKGSFKFSELIALFDGYGNRIHAPKTLNELTNHTKFETETILSVKNNSQTQIILKFDIEDIDSDTILYLTNLDFPFFDREIIDVNGKKYSSLSFGEGQLVALINQIFWFGTKEYKRTITKVYTIPPEYSYPEYADTTEFDEEINIPIDKYFIMLDEIDLSFHPEWQQRTLKYLLDVLGKIKDKSFHLIFTSHSPFLLSDIPKENVIFLDKYIEEDDEVTDGTQSIGNCKVVDGLVNKDKTFAANIHTLLSDSFFMNNNLMGEFSRTKIQNIIKFHRELEEKVKNKDTEDMQSNYEDEKEEFAYIQGIIGDDYIANVIQNHIDAIERIVYGKDYTERYKEKEIKKIIEKFGEDEVIQFLGTKDD